jgi:hypothetical protein
MEYQKYIEVDGEKFRLTGGYYKRHITIFLHRYVWEKHYGIIPKGHHIHHKDGNKLNNSIENLECLSESDHHKRTWQDDDGTQREIARNNIKKAIEWRYTEKAKPIISAKNKKAWLNRKYEKCICKRCGKEFESRLAKLAKWCTKKCCKAYHYEKEKLNDVARI